MKDSAAHSQVPGEPNIAPTLSDYKKIVQEKERFQQILENKVIELDRSNKELEEFAYIASHDLQEPLRKITSFSERIKEKLPADLAPEVQIYLDRMLVATENMRVLIENLLEFSRTSRHAQPFVSTDLNTIIQQVKADLELKIEENKAVIMLDILPSIEAIPLQITQLFTNLLTNAIKFRNPDTTPKIIIGSKLLSQEEKDAQGFPYSGNAYMISVSDNGIGFEQHYAQRIFQIFQRLHGKTEYPGSGIGLSICKKIVENHKGIMYANGEPEKGASFIFILPENQS
ncbi:MAG: ATP-binding protein [Flavitalea sp.]